LSRRIYKRNKHPEYRLILPKQAKLPTELQDEWTLCDATDHVEAEQQAEIEITGYCLCRSGPR